MLLDYENGRASKKKCTIHSRKSRLFVRQAGPRGLVRVKNMTNNESNHITRVTEQTEHSSIRVKANLNTLLRRHNLPPHLWLRLAPLSTSNSAAPLPQCRYRRFRTKTERRRNTLLSVNRSLRLIHQTRKTKAGTIRAHFQEMAVRFSSGLFPTRRPISGQTGTN